MAIHPRNDIDWLYVSRKGGRRLVIIEDCVDTSIQGLDDYIKKNKVRLITGNNCSSGNSKYRYKNNKN